MSAKFDTTRYYQAFVHIHPTKITLNKELIAGPTPHHQKKTYKENFKDNSTKGKISKSAQKKISLALDYLMYYAKPKLIPAGYRGAGLKFKISFVTMTLPARQVHSDKEVINNILEPFLNHMRKRHNLRNYIWRAEKQKAGNMHFHLIIDQFIDKHELRQVWNKYLQNLGYVSKYKDNQTDWHKNGFKLRTRLLKSWSAENQRKAYETGLKEHWTNPNTTDIHSTKHIHNLKKYLCKYLCKANHKKINDQEIAEKSSKELLTITGRMWACSESISNQTGAKSELTEEIQTELATLQERKDCETIISNYFCIYGIYVTKLSKHTTPELNKIWLTFLKEQSP